MVDCLGGYSIKGDATLYRYMHIHSYQPKVGENGIRSVATDRMGSTVQPQDLGSKPRIYRRHTLPSDQAT